MQKKREVRRRGKIESEREKISVDQSINVEEETFEDREGESITEQSSEVGDKLKSRSPLPFRQPKPITADKIQCELSQAQLNFIMRSYHIPESVMVLLLPPEWKASSPPKAYWCVYEEYSQGGLSPRFCKQC